MVDLAQYYAKYPKDKVDDLVKSLNYKKAVAELPKEESTTEPVLYVFRHGQTEDNADYIFSGWRDAKLTQLGVEQAKTLADKLKDKNIQMLIASDQTRSIHTMEIAMSLNKKARTLEIIKDKRLRERHYGDLQGQSKLEMMLLDPKHATEYRRGYDTAPPNGESIKMVVERVNNFLDEIIPLIKKEHINVAISCHGNSIRGIRRRFENLTDEQTESIETPLAQDYAAYVVR